MAKFKFRKDVNVGRVIGKIVTTVLVLWVGDKIINAVADSMTGVTSIFADGLEFIGFNVNATDQLDGTVNSTGILSVIGIIAVASIVMEFVTVKL